LSGVNKNETEQKIVLKTGLAASVLHMDNLLKLISMNFELEEKVGEERLKLNSQNCSHHFYSLSIHFPSSRD
jgi:hypothetical protein